MRSRKAASAAGCSELYVVEIGIAGRVQGLRSRGGTCGDLLATLRGLAPPAVGGPVCIDDLTVVSRLSPRAPGQSGELATLGTSWLNPLRHAPVLPDLTDEEAQAVGLWAARASRAPRDVAGAEHVYAAVIGQGMSHLHVHLLPRYPNKPREYWWDRLDEWPDAPRGGEEQIATLVRRLLAYLEKDDRRGHRTLRTGSHRADVP